MTRVRRLRLRRQQEDAIEPRLGQRCAAWLGVLSASGGAAYAPMDASGLSSVRAVVAQRMADDPPDVTIDGEPPTPYIHSTDRRRPHVAHPSITNTVWDADQMPPLLLGR